MDNEITAGAASLATLLVLYVEGYAQSTQTWIVSVIIAMFAAYALGGLLKHWDQVSIKLRHGITDYLAALIPILYITYMMSSGVCVDYCPSPSTIFYYHIYSMANLIAIGGGIVGAYFSRYLVAEAKIS